MWKRKQGRQARRAVFEKEGREERGGGGENMLTVGRENREGEKEEEEKAGKYLL